MACSITLSGLGFACKDSVGGIKRLWLADWTAADAKTSGTSTIRYSATATAFKLYQIRTGNGSMSSTLNSSEENGTSYVQTDLNFKITKLSDDLRNELEQILKGNCAAIVEDNVGNYWGLGLEHPMAMTAGSFNTGAAMADFAGGDVTLSDYCSTLPYMVDETVVTALPQTV